MPRVPGWSALVASGPGAQSTTCAGNGASNTAVPGGAPAKKTPLRKVLPLPSLAHYASLGPPQMEPGRPNYDPSVEVELMAKMVSGNQLPTPEDVLRWMAAFPPGAPIWRKQGQARFLHGRLEWDYKRCYVMIPGEGGSVNYYGAAAKIDIQQANPATRTGVRKLTAAWTQPRAGC